MTSIAPNRARDLFGPGRLGLGCMGLTGLFGPVDPTQAQRTIHHALDLGIRHFDTAELYGPFANETLLAAALSSRRETTIVATKVGYNFVDGRRVGLDSRPSSLRRAVEGCLRRLNRDRIDLVYQHRQDPNVPIEDAVGALETLSLEGKINAIGLSFVDQKQLDRASKVAPVAAVQNEFSLLSQAALPTVSPKTIGGNVFVAYSPLARGILAGLAMAAEDRIEGDYRKFDPEFASSRLILTQKRLSVLWSIARNRALEPATVALAWLLHHDPALAVIPGCRTLKQVAAAAAATEVSLTATEMGCLSLVTNDF